MSGLVPIDDDIWLVEGGLVSFYGFPYPTRMVVIRLSSGLLWIWSPIALSSQVIDILFNCSSVATTFVI